MAKDKSRFLVVVSTCPLCGNPIYGLKTVEDNGENIDAPILRTCQCQALQQALIAKQLGIGGRLEGGRFTPMMPPAPEQPETPPEEAPKLVTP